jgi:myosin-5
VSYNVKGFRFKNKDEVSAEIISGLDNCTDNYLRRILSSEEPSENSEDKNKKDSKNKNIKQGKFLGAKFRIQIKELMNDLQMCNLHFIRCIKPNENKQAEIFNSSFVLLQVKLIKKYYEIMILRENKMKK